MLATFNLDSAIRGYHVYKEVWPNPFIGEIVSSECEERNALDPFTAALQKAGTGHAPRTISSLFLRQGGTIEATVTGPQRYAADLEKGGVEIPCGYRFTGKEDSTKKAYHRLNAEQDGIGEIEDMTYVL